MFCNMLTKVTFGYDTAEISFISTFIVCREYLRGTSSRPLVEEADLISTTIVQNVAQHQICKFFWMDGLSQTWHHLQTFRLLVWSVSVSRVHHQGPVDEIGFPVAEFSSGNAGDGVAPVGCLRVTWSVCQLPTQHICCHQSQFSE